jgi:hypothetical protein
MVATIKASTIATWCPSHTRPMPLCVGQYLVMYPGSSGIISQFALTISLDEILQSGVRLIGLAGAKIFGPLSRPIQIRNSLPVGSLINKFQGGGYACPLVNTMSGIGKLGWQDIYLSQHIKTFLILAHIE